jgi:hypothetical protein
MERKLLLAGLALSLGVAAWTGPAGAQLFTSTGPVIAIRDGELLVGEATGDLGGWGTIALRSRAKAGRTCVGEFSHSEALGDSGQLRCSDGASAAFRFQRLSLRRGYGAGSSSGSALSFTYTGSARGVRTLPEVACGQGAQRREQQPGAGRRSTVPAALSCPPTRVAAFRGCADAAFSGHFGSRKCRESS